MLFEFIYGYWCPTRFAYHMMLEWFNSSTTCATSVVGSGATSVVGSGATSVVGPGATSVVGPA